MDNKLIYAELRRFLWIVLFRMATACLGVHYVVHLVTGHLGE